MKNRTRRTQPLHNFAARCPNGHRPPQSRTLRELKDPKVRFYCQLCEQEWRPEANERVRAVGFAEASEEWTLPPAA